MTDITNRAWGFLFFAVVAALVVGCEPADTGPATYAVTGTITQGGQPVDGATVTFFPVGEGKAASGRTDESGKYTLTTFAGKKGALPGDYTIKVVKYVGEEPAAPVSDDPEAEYEATYSGAEDGGSQAENVLPKKYESRKDSGLTATVTENPSENVFDFDLDQ